MKIAIGNDHAGVEMKKYLTEYLQKKGHEVINFGSDIAESVDYPVYAAKVGKAVASGECDRGILLCGTGVGISIAANKVHGVRCALCSEPFSAKLTRMHNDANVLAMGGRTLGAVMMEEIVDVFLTTEFQGGRHQKRVDLVMKLEQEQTLD